MVSVSRYCHFNAAHRLFNPKWDDEKNKSVFGKCSNPHYHGHNYELIATVTGDVNPETGFVMDLKLLADILEDEVENRFDHKNINEELKEFEDLNPTAENIAIVIWNLLRPKIETKLQLKVTLYETPRNFVEYSGI